ncbi:DUF4892 domain-containing protein [Marinomonas ostreistagni]|uniref:DUF4892 domain-containing protein n=1 Tax=Marinomonas ostreistagni TaxID=359209 RepID=A0ABS0ZG68_9GAMM|nr:DUF4892 domain-containing protein [Marinomonas ostreistagni]MBJ7551901.1 DUF4892 domain-containing protein [Marinomonas ostreistagni]
MLRNFVTAFTAACCLSSTVVFATEASNNQQEIPVYRSAQIVKSTPVENASFEIPLAKIYRSGRGWEPEKVTVVEGSSVRTLYKIGRNVPMESVESFYDQAIRNLDGVELLFECHSRSCGSSNAWANNFFNDYLLYGADSSQTLWVAKDAQQHYWVVYLNRRGAGDVMVRIDEIIPQDSEQNIAILAQFNANDIPRIRRFLSETIDLSSIIGFVTSKADNRTAVSVGDQYIHDIQLGLSPEERRDVRFINLADMGDPALGSDRVVFIRNQ